MELVYYPEFKHTCVIADPKKILYRHGQAVGMFSFEDGKIDMEAAEKIYFEKYMDYDIYSCEDDDEEYDDEFFVV